MPHGFQELQPVNRSADVRRRGALRRRITGFTIIELAISLAVIGVLAGAVLVPFVAQVAQRNTAATEKTLELIKEALLGYATATGRLPCPASAASNGVEVFAAGGTIGNGNCASFNGFLHAVTLGFTPIDSQGFAIDGWGTAQNRIRYAVSNQTINGVNNPFTRVNGMRSATAAQMASTALLYVCNSGAGVVAGTNCGAAVRLTDNAPVVIWSVGANAATGGTSVDEAENPNPNGGSADRIFVSHTAQSVAGSEFDDIVTWISVGNVVSRMVLGGQLP
jgi:prepilin-type N-terminal cleavage/methylation domain-containing protein